MIDVVSYLNTGLATQPKTKEAGDEMGKDSFMQLLIAQMSHQDPMKPMENTEFIAQLAQFSALEQQQNIAAGIELLALTQTASTNSQMVNLIGKRVVVPGSDISVDGESGVDLRFDLTEETAPTEVIISDKEGNVVRRIPIEDYEMGSNTIRFDGKDNDGNALESGNYSYNIVGQNNTPLEGITQYSNYLVDSVAFNGSAILLKSEGEQIDLADISEVIKN